MELAITTDFHDDGGPIEPKLAMFAAAGFRHIHWCEHWSRDVLYEDFYVEGLAKLLAHHGIRLVDTHNAEGGGAALATADETSRRRGVRLLENRVRFTRMLGGDCVVVHPGPFHDPDAAAFRAKWDGLERSLADVARLCEDSGVRIGLENMARAMPPEFPALLAKYPPGMLGFCYDSGHANIAGEIGLIERLGDRLIALHLHDNHGAKDEHALPGDGTIPWNRIVAALTALRYAKPVNFELSMRNSTFYTDMPPAQFVAEAWRRCNGVTG